MNSHYVPKFILKNFGERICLYDIQKGSLSEDVKLEKAYAQKGFYSDDVEDLLNRRVESQFANLFNQTLSREGLEIRLKRAELRLVKKFLLISIIRSMGTETFLQKEKTFYTDLEEYAAHNGERCMRDLGLDPSDLKNRPLTVTAPFEEKLPPSENDFTYWMRTLKVILETDGSPDEILKHPDKTYPAHRWAQIVDAGYLAFWDSNGGADQFVITDVGMTSENEVGWDGIRIHNMKKLKCLLQALQNTNNHFFQLNIARMSHMVTNFHENFQMFPVSANRMIVLISPFFKFRHEFRNYFSMPPLEHLTVLANEELFLPNQNYYVYPQDPPNYHYHENDEYIYQVKKLTAEEVRYCNALFMDRVSSLLGFPSLRSVVRSAIAYKKYNEPPYTPRVDYSRLYQIIEERYGGRL